MAKPEANEDWTADLPQTDHVRFFRTTDWSSSALGPLAQWDSTLRNFTRMLFADSRAACLWWCVGADSNLVAIYNDAYKPLASHAHPKLMGTTFQEGYPDLWLSICTYFERARAGGRGIDYSPAESLVVDRSGYREEAFFNGNFVPIGSGPTNQPEGFYNSLVEVTSQRLADRRAMLLNRLASVPDLRTATASHHVIETLKTNEADIPLAMLYEVDEDASPSLLRLRGHIGLPPGHNLIVDNQTLASADGIFPDCRRAGLEPLFIDHDERFESVSWAGFGTPSKQIAILPITSAARLFGYLVIGTNPYRPLDDACHQFVRDLGRMVASIVSAAASAEETKKRQQQLEHDLAFSDTKLRHLIEHASVGMAHVSIDGYVIWANDHYYALSGMSAEEHLGQWNFFNVYLEEDVLTARETWANLLDDVDRVSVELRLKRLYTSPSGETEPAQLQVLAFPYRENGKVQSVMACTTDISRLKWAQKFQARRAAEAREAKRQQEAFIDVVSHEMRNPLSAIVHCADAITSAVDDCRAQDALGPEPCLEALSDNYASAQIIMQCAEHQKRIIDDILTLSKLDSMLLSITPSAVGPAKLVSSVINIFEAELKSNGVRYSVQEEPSMSQLDVGYLYLDPSRVTQIFINLVTNAIKFVKTSQKPSISIRFGACTSSPRSFFAPNTFFASTKKEPGDVTGNSEWGTGEEIYLCFAVKDSGIGLKTEEIHRIFEKFHQANMKTHVKYGGSGLGLFISKELTEKQGGEIGVSSIVGEGSTFGFYVKTRRAEKEPRTVDEVFQENGIASPTPQFQQLHVLLVEDNIINQQVLGKQLKKAGCVVDLANHGLEALDILEKKSFDIVLMDLEMPVLNGLAAMKEIRKRELGREGQLGQRERSRLPVVAVTANVRKEQIDSAIAAGADRVMQKPFRAAELVQMMNGLVLQATPERTTPDTTGPQVSNGI